MKRSVSLTRSSGKMLRNGVCPSCTPSACLRVPSNTASPVELTKSASNTVSLSVSAGERLEYNTPAVTAINTIAAPIAAETL